MKTIKENIVNKIIINKSTFIACLIKIKNKDEVKSIIDDLKKEYKDATHYCYGYIVNNEYGMNDDGEPSGTAGLPILDLLKKKELDYILCVVIRYFGGIKLGAGGLVRAYRKSVLEAIKKANVIELINGYYIELEESYDKQREIEYLLDNNYEKEYNELIKYKIYCDKETYDKLLKYNITIKKETLIEK